MTRTVLFCLFFLSACRNDDHVVITSAPPTHVEILIDGGRATIVYDLPDESWKEHEGIDGSDVMFEIIDRR